MNPNKVIISKPPSPAVWGSQDMAGRHSALSTPLPGSSLQVTAGDWPALKPGGHIQVNNPAVLVPAPFGAGLTASSCVAEPCNRGSVLCHGFVCHPVHFDPVPLSAGGAASIRVLCPARRCSQAWGAPLCHCWLAACCGRRKCANEVLFFVISGNLPYEYKIVIAGNHELTFDKEFMADLVKQDYYRFPSVSKLKPEDFDNVQSLLTNSIYLQDSEVTVKGFRIYGAPW